PTAAIRIGRERSAGAGGEEAAASMPQRDGNGRAVVVILQSWKGRAAPRGHVAQWESAGLQTPRYGGSIPPPALGQKTSPAGIRRRGSFRGRTLAGEDY